MRDATYTLYVPVPTCMYVGGCSTYIQGGAFIKAPLYVCENPPAQLSEKNETGGRR